MAGGVNTIFSTEITTTDNHFHFIGGAASSYGAGATTYSGVGGSTINNSPESIAQFKTRVAFTLSNFYVRVNSNAVSGTSTATFRKNAVNGNQTVSYAGAATGQFEDVTNTDSVAIGDEIAVQVVTGATGTVVVISPMGFLALLPSGNTVNSSFLFFM